VTNAEQEEKGPPPPRRALWPWVVGALIGVAAIGAGVGAWLGTRQGPVSAQGSVGARPTIVIASASPAVSASSSPAPSVVAPTAVAAGQGQQATAYTEYVVQPGDTLRSIAEREYGDATQWPRIYEANQSVIGPDPDTLVAGTTLRLPTPD